MNNKLPVPRYVHLLKNFAEIKVEEAIEWKTSSYKYNHEIFIEKIKLKAEKCTHFYNNILEEIDAQA